MKTGAVEILGSRYRIVKPLGGGGMKSVYLAEDLKLSRRLCAVAEMIDNFANPEEQQAAVAAFQREADMLASLKDEHIPQIYDKFSEQQSHYLVMEFVEGDTLENRVKAAGGRLSVPETIDTAIQILETLEYLHGLNPPVIYRDMKPGNVMVTPAGKVKLIDFGIARFFQQSRMTTVGTPGYAPREQYGGKVEGRSDLYALAATLHETLSSRPAVPFDFPPLTQLQPGINQHLSDLIAQALADNVEDRVPSAREFKNRLAAIKVELAAAPGQSIQPNGQGDDRTVPLRTEATQPDSQTWTLKDGAPASGRKGQGGSPASLQSSGRQGSSQDMFSEPTEKLSTEKLHQVRGSQGGAGTIATFAGQEEQTAILDPRRLEDSGAAGVDFGKRDQTREFRERATRKGTDRRKMLIAAASIAAIAAASFIGVNQWKEVQHEKALVAAHEEFERQQQQALQAAERQRELQQQALQAQQRQQELLLQQQAQRNAELKRQQQEAALERRRWRQQQQQEQQPAPAPNSPYPPVAQAPSGSPNGTMGGGVTAGAASALGGLVGGLIGGALSRGSSGGSTYSAPAYPSQPYERPHQYH